jgi:uncharacterized cupin superfamily protein
MARIRSSTEQLDRRVLMLSSMIRGEIIEYLDTRKLLAKDIEDEDIMFARPGRTVEYRERED